MDTINDPAVCPVCGGGPLTTVAVPAVGARLAGEEGRSPGALADPEPSDAGTIQCAPGIRSKGD